MKDVAAGCSALHRVEVMKFAKHLKEAKLAKYEGCYFGYSSLKTTLKQLVEEKPNIKGYLQAAEHGLTDRIGNQFYDDHAGKEMTMVETFIESKGFQVRRQVSRRVVRLYGGLSESAAHAMTGPLSTSTSCISPRPLRTPTQPRTACRGDG